MGKDYDQLLESVRDAAKEILKLNQQAVKQYTLVVDDIIRMRCRDVSHIEHALDGLLDFCGYEPARQLFRRLCRHYWDIDPFSTAQYVHAYRDLWDSESNPPDGGVE